MDMTIDELAREAGTTVRSVRVYHERGVLPSPLMKGRTGFYGDEHLNRVRTIGRLLDRGIKLNGIRELLEAWDRGDDLSDVLGVPDRELPATATEAGDEGALSSEVASTSFVELDEPLITAAELSDRYRDIPNGFARVVAIGMYEPVDATTYRVVEPHSLRLIEQFEAWGASPARALDEMERIRSDCDRLARRVVDTFERTAALEKGDELASHAAAARLIAGQAAAALVDRFVVSHLKSAELSGE